MVGGGPEGSNCASGMVAFPRSPPLQPAVTRTTTAKTTTVTMARRSGAVTASTICMAAGTADLTGFTALPCARKPRAAARVYCSSTTPKSLPVPLVGGCEPTIREAWLVVAGLMGFCRSRRHRGDDAIGGIGAYSCCSTPERSVRTRRGHKARRVACGGASRPGQRTLHPVLRLALAWARLVPYLPGWAVVWGFLPYAARNERSGQGGFVSRARWRPRRLGGSVLLI